MFDVRCSIVSRLVESESDLNNLPFNNNPEIAYVTQTTLSIDDTKEIIGILKRKYPNIIGPDLDDICYATQNRQIAVRELASQTELVIVIGGENSSNTKRLAEIVDKQNVPVYRIASVEDINESWFKDLKNIGITAGASSPEILITEVIEFIKTLYKEVNIIKMNGVKENIKFKPLETFS